MLCLSGNARGNFVSLSSDTGLDFSLRNSVQTDIPISVDKPQIQIYGWYPYWMKDAYENLNYDLLTTVSYYSVNVYLNANKSLSYRDNGLDTLATKLIQKAKDANCKVDLTFQCDDTVVIDMLLKNKTFQDSCISYLTQLVDSTFLDGICVDFDKLPAKNDDAYVSFLRQLKVSLKKSQKTLRITLPANDFSNRFNISKLNEVVDAYILLAFNYYHKGSAEGTVAPLDDDGNFDIKRSVNIYVEKGIPMQKMIVALPTYGIVWQKTVDGSASVFEDHIYLSQIKKDLTEIDPKPVIKLDSTTFTKQYHYKNNGTEYRTYFDDDETLKVKIKWLRGQGIAGVGIWALGYDNGSSEVWDMIENNFVVKIPNKESTEAESPNVNEKKSSFIPAAIITLIVLSLVGLVFVITKWRIKKYRL